MAEFISPVIQDNPTGWGPCQLPEKFKDMPYQPFSKSDRLGKVIYLNDLRIITYKYRFLIGPAQHIRTENMSISTNLNLLRKQTINTRISTTKMSHHSNWSTILRPNLEIDFSHDLEDREVDSVSLNLYRERGEKLCRSKRRQSKTFS